jgi:cysteine desulfurase
VGAAILRRGLPIVPLHHGGGQDRGVRSGTFAVGLDAACGAALGAAVADRGSLRARLTALSDRLAHGLTALPGVRRNGPSDPSHRLASHVHVSLEGVGPEALGLELDRAGLAASSGAACGAGATKASHVLEAAQVTGTPLRLSLGWTSTDADVDRALDILTEVIPRLRADTQRSLAADVGSALSGSRDGA